MSLFISNQNDLRKQGLISQVDSENDSTSNTHLSYYGKTKFVAYRSPKDPLIIRRGILIKFYKPKNENVFALVEDFEFGNYLKLELTEIRSLQNNGLLLVDLPTNPNSIEPPK